MSIATEIARLQQAKADLKASIIAKGGTITDETIDEYASKVSALPSPKEEQTKTVSPTTSSQDVLPDANKVLSKVTVNAIPTETKSQQPDLSSGDQVINATSGKFMTSFTITKDIVNHIDSNIRSGITLYGVTGNLQPAKEEETKTVTPNFSSGSVDVTPTTGKVLSQVMINKDSNLVASNIKKDITVHGITGTLQQAKEEETKTLEPDFSGGNQIITPTGGKVMTSVTLTKPTDLLPENIAKDKNVCGVVGTSFIAVELTQAEYDALETKDSNTYYLIKAGS